MLEIDLRAFYLLIDMQNLPSHFSLFNGEKSLILFC